VGCCSTNSTNDPSNNILGEMYEKQGEFLDEWAKHEQRPYLRGKVVDFLGQDFLF
jgi:hypothetical protein